MGQKNDSQTEICLWKFDKNGKLIHTTTNKFFTSSSIPSNVKNYVTNYIKTQLLQRGFQELKKNSILFYKPPPNLNQSKKIVFLLPGSGKFQNIGELSLKICVYINVNQGSYISFVDYFIENKYHIILLNPNAENVKKGDDKEFVKKCWEQYGKKYETIGFLAHSYGGVLVLDILKNIQIDEIKKIKFICFGDSVHSVYEKSSLEEKIENLKLKKFLKNNCVNYIVSKKEQEGEFISFDDDDIKQIGSGTDKHSHTMCFAKDLIFEYINEKVID